MEPTLSEISNMRIDPELSGIAPNPVIDNSKMIEELNSQGRFHAEQVAQKYNQFLQNKKDLFSKIGDIEGLETLPEDRPVLNQQAAGIFADILKDPSVVRGGQGYGELIAKISKYKNDAMASKMSYLDTHANNTLLAHLPAMDTPENRDKIAANNKLPPAQRKTVALSTPTILDRKSLAESIFTKNPLVKTTFSNPITAKDGSHYIESGTYINPKAFLGEWNQVAKGGMTDKNNKDLVNAIKFQYDNSPNKKDYEKEGGGGMEKYWNDVGESLLNGYTQNGIKDEETGNYITNVKKTSDPSYNAAQSLELRKQQLAEKTQHDRDMSHRDWVKIGLTRDKMGKSTGEDVSDARATLNDLADTFKNATPVAGKKNVFELHYLPFMKTYGLIDKRGNPTGSVEWDKSTDTYRIYKKDVNGKTTIIPFGPGLLIKSGLDEQTKGVKANSASSKIIQELMDNKYGKSLSKLTEALNAPPEEKKPASTGTGTGTKQSTPKPEKLVMKNKKDYYYDQSNIKSKGKNSVIYKDGTEWEIKGNKFIQIK